MNCHRISPRPPGRRERPLGGRAAATPVGVAGPGAMPYGGRVETPYGRHLAELLAAPAGHQVSIFLPTLRGSLQAGLARERLGVLLATARHALLESGLDEAASDRILAPPQGLLRNELFWRHPGESLALFAAPDLFLNLRLPLRLEEEVTVGERFRVRPLLDLLGGEDQVYVLALSAHDVRLLECGEGRAREVELRTLPADLARCCAPAPAPAAAAAGSGRARRDEILPRSKEQLVRCLRLVDSSLRDALPQRGGRLVLAGDPPLTTLYRLANTQPGLAAEEIPGDPFGVAPEEIYQRGRDLLEPLLSARSAAAAADFDDLAAAGDASTLLSVIVPEASAGGVATLFIARDGLAPGRFDPGCGRFELHGEAQAGDEDLLDAAAFFTLRSGGEVFALDRRRMPGGGVAAARLRSRRLDR